MSITSTVAFDLELVAQQNSKGPLWGQALITLVDVDSFQVSDSTSGAIFRCPVGKPEFTPPELQGKAFADIDRTFAHDLFGLAVGMFRLLMEGIHPFNGVFSVQGDPPLLENRISSGQFPHGKRRVAFRPKPSAP